MLPKPKEQKLPCRLVAQTGGTEAEFIGQSELYFGDTLCIPCTSRLGSPACKLALLLFQLHLSYTGESGLLWPSLGKTSLDQGWDEETWPGLI